MDLLARILCEADFEIGRISNASPSRAVSLEIPAGFTLSPGDHCLVSE